MLSANGVTVRFGKRVLFENVNLEFIFNFFYKM